MYIFISHSSKEAAIADGLCSAIEGSGHDCFIAPRDIRSGYEYAEEIADGIDRADVVLLLLSKASNNSPHVLREIERAVSKSIPIIVYKLEEVALAKSMEYFLMTRQWMVAGRDSYEDVVKCLDNLESLEIKAKEKNKRAGKFKNDRAITVFLLAVILCLLLVVVVLLVTIGISGQSEQENMVTSAESSEDNRPAIGQEIQTGDTLVMGNYDGEDIFWRVLKISEDGTEAVIVARDVLTMKAYDAPESGKYNHDGERNYFFSEEGKLLEKDMELQAYVQGNSTWESSAIRTWLNSAQENVKYEGQAPTSASTADGVNGYHDEKGFLCNFTEEELAIIKATDVETKTNVLLSEDTIVTRDKVFLLSMDELKWFEEADVSIFAAPTESAVAKDQCYWYRDYCLSYGVENTMWWLREPVADAASLCYLVGNGYREENIYTWEVGAEGFGIRPAMTIDLTKGNGYDIIR